MKTKLIFWALVSMGFANAAMADDKRCGDGTIDRIVGQYVGAHDVDSGLGTNPSDLAVYVGGSGIITEIAALGAGSAWVTGSSPLGMVGAPIMFSWRNMSRNTYSMTGEVLVGTPTPLQGFPGVGTFPTTDFQRAYVKGKVTLSDHCKTLKMRFNVCFVAMLPSDPTLKNLKPCIPTSKDPQVSLIYNKLQGP